MTINRINYEEYIVSSLEGMLSTEEQASLDAFLHEHPELRQEVDIYKRVFLVPDRTITYPNKSLLLKPEQGKTSIPSYRSHSRKITIINYEEFVVSSLEGSLTTEEQASLDAFLHDHPELKPEIDAYKLAFLVPDKSISYPHKSLLLKQEPLRTVTPFYRRYSVWLSIAATILLLIAFRTFLYNDDYSERTNNAPVAESQSVQQGYALSGSFDLPGRQEQENFISSIGNPEKDRIANTQNNVVQTVNRQGRESINQVAVIPARETYLPQAQLKPHFASLPMTNSERVLAVAQRVQAQRNQSALISNAATVGKTLWHLSGRQLPGETQSGQQFHVVQVDYNSKDFSFVKIIH